MWDRWNDLKILLAAIQEQEYHIMEDMAPIRTGETWEVRLAEVARVAVDALEKAGYTGKEPELEPLRSLLIGDKYDRHPAPRG